MTKWIRWPGLLGFVILIALIVVGWLLFAGVAAKAAIEASGRAALDLPVTVEEVNLSFNPIGFDMKNLQVPDPNDRNQDQLVLRQGFAEINLGKLLRGKVVIEHLQVNDMLFNQPRQTPWEPLPVEQKEEPKAQASSATADDDSKESKPSPLAGMVQMPSIDELLGSDTLLVNQQSEKLKQTTAQAEKNISDALAEVPTEQDLTNYQAQFQKITGTPIKDLDDFRQRQKQLAELKNNLQQEQKDIQNARSTIDDELSAIRSGTQSLSQAPSKDLAALREKFQFNNTGLNNLSQMLFSEQLQHWLSTADTWYQRLEPYLPEGEDEPKPVRVSGRDVLFPTDQPDPGFWLKEAAINATNNNQAVNITLQDFTSDYDQVKQPALLTVRQELNNRKFALNGEFVPNLQQFDLSLTGVGVNNTSLIKQPDMNVSLQKSDLEVTGNATIKKGVLNLTVNNDFDNADFVSSGSSTLAKELSRALANIDQFRITATAKGKLNGLAIGLKSDLDKQLSSAFNQRIKEEQAALEKELKDRLQQQADQALAPVKEKLAEFEQQKAALQAKLKEAEAMMKQELEDFEARLRKEAEEKRKAAEAALQAEKEKAQQELEDKLKDQVNDQLKNLNLPGLK